jgi:hypothetical protein
MEHVERESIAIWFIATLVVALIILCRYPGDDQRGVNGLIRLGAGLYVNLK